MIIGLLYSLDVDGASHCNIYKNGVEGEFLKQTVAIIWDEAPLTQINSIHMWLPCWQVGSGFLMQHRYCMEAVIYTLWDVSKPLSGIVVLWAGDFRPSPPVVEKGNREETVYACIQHSYLLSTCSDLPFDPKPVA